MARYSATDVARYMVNLCIEEKSPVSNLQVQKILYFCQQEYYVKTGTPLFDDDFEAWRYGPVVPSVYRTYSVYGGSPIWKAAEYKEFDFFRNDSVPVAPLSGKERKSVVETVEKWACLPSWEIVNRSHVEGGAWDIVYNKNGVPGSGLHEVIPLSVIRETLFAWES